MRRALRGLLVVALLGVPVVLQAAPDCTSLPRHSRAYEKHCGSATTTTSSTTTTSTSTSTTSTTSAPTTTLTPTTTSTTVGSTTTTMPHAYQPPSGVSVTPATLSSAVSSNPAGTVFILEDGIYTPSQLVPKNDQQFWAATLHGAVLDGGNTRTWAIVNHDTGNPVTGVEFHGLEVRYYLASPGNGALGGGGADGWLYEDLLVHHNGYSGIGVGPNSTIRRVQAFDNGETGIASPNPTGLLVEDTILYRNGFREGLGWRDATGSTGGMKILHNTVAVGDPIVIRNSLAYDNFGPGFWIDFVLNTQVTFTNVTAVDNDGPGLFLEASRPGPILVERADVKGSLNWHGIYISGSEMVTVTDSKVDGRGIMVSEDNTSDRSVRDAHVFNNVITNLVAGSHGAQSQSGFNIFDSNRIEFTGNSYPDVSGSPFRWDGANLSFAQWQAVGQDD